MNVDILCKVINENDNTTYKSSQHDLMFFHKDQQGRLSIRWSDIQDWRQLGDIVQAGGAPPVLHLQQVGNELGIT